MLCSPTLSATLQSALAAAIGTALQPGSDIPPSVKVTVPVGATPATAADNVTGVPACPGLTPLESDVVVGARSMTCVIAPIAVTPNSGLLVYSTVIGCAPTDRVVWQLHLVP